MVDVDDMAMVIKKSKLVTLCCQPTKNDDFARLYVPYTYQNSSKSYKTDVKLSFPAFPCNAAYYEHFDNVKSQQCSSLSFIFLGGNEKGGLYHNFGEYQQVTAVDFFYAFASVGSLFTLINQLPKCREVRFFLDQDNLRLSKSDQQAFPLNNPPISHTVTALTIEKVGNIDPYIWNQESTRLTAILHYAYACFPNLKSVKILMNGDGRNYDLVQNFVQGKPNLPKHDVTLKDNLVTCTPSVSTSAAVNHRKRSFDKAQVTTPAPVLAKQLTPAPVPTVMQNADVNTGDDKDKVVAPAQIKIKQEIEGVPDIQVIEIKHEVVSPPPLANLPSTPSTTLSCETEVNTGAITPVMSPAPVASYQQQQVAVTPVRHSPCVPRVDRTATPTAPFSPNCGSGTSQPPQSPVTTERAPSSDIGSSFNDWENSSESGEDDTFLNRENCRRMTHSRSRASPLQKSNPMSNITKFTDSPVKLICGKPIPREILNNVNPVELQNILQTARDSTNHVPVRGPPTAPPPPIISQFRNSHSDNNYYSASRAPCPEGFKEGVHFERRRKPKRERRPYY